MGTYKFNINGQEIAAISNGINLSCIFNHKGQEYLADITVRSDRDFQTELIIFKTTNGQFSFVDALGVCSGLNIGFDWESLKTCVEDFIKFN